MAYLLLYCSHQNKNVITGREGKIKLNFSKNNKKKKNAHAPKENMLIKISKEPLSKQN